MQIKIYTIPILDGELLAQELNTFLRSKKILSVDQHLIQDGQAAFWTFCIKYLDDPTVAERDQQKTDYRKVLDEETFKRFAQLRETRKRISTEENIPSYVIFTDAELANLAKLDPLTLENMKTVKGIAERKIEKYGRHFAQREAGEKS